MNEGPRPTILFCCCVWPEPTSSAAGVRTLQLIRACADKGWRVVLTSPSKLNSFSEAMNQKGFETHTFEPNDPAFDSFIRNLNPDFVLFDRFILEEQFGWRVHDQVPHAVRIVDTQDLHFLRRARQNALDAGTPLEQIFAANIDLRNEDAFRELGSAMRSDGTLIISMFEMDLLRSKFNFPESLLHLCRFGYPAPALSKLQFEDRKNFVFIGNFRHPPNWDGLKWLRYEVWPRIRAELPQTEMHLYGAYISKEAQRLESRDLGFHLKGWAPESIKTLEQYRVNVAPLRVGAGIKGKICDGWLAGTPCITTPVGAEGMHDELPFGGSIARTVEDFSRSAVQLYSEKSLWQESQANGYKIMSQLFSEGQNSREFVSFLEITRSQLQQKRTGNWIGQLLWTHAYRSTTYFSRWIETKNLLQNYSLAPVKDSS